MNLDHFYIGVSSFEFQPLLPIANALQGCQHLVVQSGNDSWEGIYLFSNAGPYFEILNERRNQGLGIAFCTTSETRQIIARMSDLPWKSGTRHRANGSPWFDWLSLGEYLNVKETWFNAWIMRYCESSKPRTAPAFSIKRFLSLKMSLGNERLDEMKSLARWFPEPFEMENSRVTVFIADRSGDRLKIEIQLVTGNEKFTFHSIDFELNDGVNVSQQDFGVLRLSQDKNIASITRL